MDSKTRATLIASNPLAWITLSGVVSENQVVIEFKDHRFLIDLYADLHDDIVVRKSAQVGESVERILKSIWCAGYMGANVIYVLPTNNVVKDFVTPKVNPIITSNPVIQAMVRKDSESIKQIHNRFIYFKGAFSEREAISISGDILVLDELDRMPDMNVVNTYDSRLQASKLGMRWRLSNPSGVGYGVDALFQDSDQRHWFVTCSHCGHKMFMDFAQSDEKNHYIDKESQQYVCGKPSCQGVIDDEARRFGFWVAKYPGRRRHGYWINQLVAPWVSAARILEQQNESSIEFFYNFVLGKAYTPSDLVVNRETILRATAPSVIPKVNVVMGVDQSASAQIWVAGTPQGIFAHGKTKAWEEIEHLKLMWNAVVVCDPAPYPIMPKLMASKYQDWYMCRFKQFADAMTTIQWKGHTVYADRTRLLDTVANEITEAKILFRETPYALEDYIADWSNIYRTTEDKADGRSRSVWLKKENKDSDFSLATCLIAGTMVKYGNGEQPIERIKPGDMVLTRKGYKRVTAAGQTGIKKVIRAEFTDGSELIGTPDHQVFTKNRGFVSLAELTDSDIFEVCRSKRNTSIFKVRGIQDIRTRSSAIIGYISAPRLNRSICSIKPSGSAIMARFRKGLSSIIKIMTPLIMTPEISFALAGESTNLTMPENGRRGLVIVKKPLGLQTLFIRLKLKLNPQLGNEAQQEKRTMPDQNSGEAFNKIESLLAPDVIKHSLLSGAVIINFVPKLAVTIFTCRNEKRLKRIVPLKGKRPVYNISVEDQPEFYANGVLVHNCYWRAGLAKILTGGSLSSFAEPKGIETMKADYVTTDGQLLSDVGNRVEMALAGDSHIYMQEKEDAWLYQ